MPASRPDSLPFDIVPAEPHAVAYNAMCVNATSVLATRWSSWPRTDRPARTRMAASGANPLIVAGLTGDEARLEAAARLVRPAW
jgi:hypothetical protein